MSWLFEARRRYGLSVLDSNALANTKRGFLYLALDEEFNEGLVSNNNIALINGPGKGRIRSVYDPDITIDPGIDLNPGQVIDTKIWPTITDPSAPATISNDNLFVDASGYGSGSGIYSR